MDRRPFIAVSLGALVLSGCGGAPETPPPGAGEPRTGVIPARHVSATDKAAEPVAKGDAVTAPARAPASDGPTETAALPAAPPPPPRPSILAGLTDAAVVKLLGPPAFRRVDDPAALWRYRSRDCVLDLFLYADGPVYRVSHYAFRGKGAAGAGGPASCLGRLVAAPPAGGG